MYIYIRIFAGSAVRCRVRWWKSVGPHTEVWRSGKSSLARPQAVYIISSRPQDGGGLIFNSCPRQAHLSHPHLQPHPTTNLQVWLSHQPLARWWGPPTCVPTCPPAYLHANLHTRDNPFYTATIKLKVLRRSSGRRRVSSRLNKALQIAPDTAIKRFKYGNRP